MKAGRYATGCPALAESYRADPHPGVLFTLAECEARWGKLATAVAHYEDFLRLAAAMPPSQRQKARADLAQEQITALREQVPTLTVTLPPSAPQGTIVRKDGLDLGRSGLGVPLPTDPGEHVITTRAPGGSEHQQSVTLERGEHAKLEVAVEPAATEMKPREEGKGPPDGPGTQPKGGDAQGTSPLRTIGMVVGGVGLAAAAVGIGTGIVAWRSKASIASNCVETVCNPDGVDAADRGKAFALASTIGFVVGGVGIATGAVLLLASPRAPPRQSAAVPIVAVGRHGTYAALRASF
jgi:hypothetical protein